MTDNILILGFGYTARHYAALLIKSGYKIKATTRSLEKIKEYQNHDVNVVLHTDENIIPLIHKATHILISAPPNKNGDDPILSRYRDQIIKQAGHLKWLGYLSSTGVYGDHKGLWVDEKSAQLEPGQRGLQRAKVENEWLALQSDFKLPIHIFRLSGIYGPERNMLIKLSSQNYQPVIKKGHFFSRIHVSDISRALLLSMEHPTPGEVYNITDDTPSPIQEVYSFAAHCLGLTEPEGILFEKATLSPMMQQFYRCNRKVSNQKFKNTFGFSLKYPSYIEGLTDLYKELTAY
jgi:nucleoside-diphosphate-sugar epimerase